MTSSDTIRIGVTQHSCAVHAEANISKAMQQIDSLAKDGAKIICLQELFHARYFCSSERAELFDLAIENDDPVFRLLGDLAAKYAVVLIVPYFEKRAPGVYHNSAVVIDADGAVLGRYRKMHIPHDPLFYEKYYFSPGETGEPQSGFKVFKTRYASIGVLICWDQWFPEAARITALCGAQILFYPTAIGWHPIEKAEFGKAQVDAWRTIQRSHAIANGVFVATANRVGFEPTPGTDGIEFFGNSFISDPFGRLIAEATSSDEQTLIADVDLSLIEDTRRNWPFLRDRRVDAYGPIVSRYIGVK